MILARPAPGCHHRMTRTGFIIAGVIFSRQSELGWSLDDMYTLYHKRTL